MSRRIALFLLAFCFCLALYACQAVPEAPLPADVTSIGSPVYVPDTPASVTPNVTKIESPESTIPNISESPSLELSEPPQTSPESGEPALTVPSRDEVVRRFEEVKPVSWGEVIDGVISQLSTYDGEKVIALTFDAFGGGKGSGYDEELIELLISERIPATLFISGKWIEDNLETFSYLASQDVFEIENHGYRHKPLSVTGSEAYGITGTASPGEVYDEVNDNADRIYELTGRRPVFFRSGTAFYDDVAVKIVGVLGMRVAGFTVAADGGATYSAQQIQKVCSNPPSGAILLFHMNHPEGNTFEGVKAIYKILKEDGYSFAKLEDFNY